MKTLSRSKLSNITGRAPQASTINFARKQGYLLVTFSDKGVQ